MPKNKKVFEYLAVFALIVGLVVVLACTSDSDEETPDFTGMEGRWDFSAIFLQSSTSTSSAIGEAPAEVTTTTPNYYTGYFYFDENGAISSGYVYLNGSTTSSSISGGQTYKNKDGVTYNLTISVSNGDALTLERWAPTSTLRTCNGRISSSLYGYGMWDAYRYDSSVTFGTSGDFAGTWNFHLTNSAGYLTGSFSASSDGTIYEGSIGMNSGTATTSVTGSLSNDTSANVTSTITYATSYTIVFKSVKMNSSKNAMGGIAQSTSIGTGRFVAYRTPVTSYTYADLSGDWLMTILDLNSSLWYVGVTSLSGTSSTTITGTIWKSTNSSENTYSGNASISTAGSTSITMTDGTESFSLGGYMDSTKQVIDGLGTSNVESTCMFVMVKLPSNNTTGTTVAPGNDTTGTTVTNYYTGYSSYSSYSSYGYSWELNPMNLKRNDDMARQLADSKFAEREDI